MNRAHVNIEPPPAPAYDVDFALWAAHQEMLLREHRFDLLDLDNLIEEVGDMGHSARRELGNRLARLMAHLLKCAYQPRRKSRSWLSTIHEQRRRLRARIDESPSLAREVQAVADDEYEDAAEQAAIETGLPRASFPPSNPYTREQLLDRDFIP